MIKMERLYAIPLFNRLFDSPWICKNQVERYEFDTPVLKHEVITKKDVRSQT